MSARKNRVALKCGRDVEQIRDGWTARCDPAFGPQRPETIRRGLFSYRRRRELMRQIDDEAMKEVVRQSIGLLTGRYGMDRATALAYLSAGVDFEVSQVVDKTKSVHVLIPKADFSALAVD